MNHPPLRYSESGPIAAWSGPPSYFELKAELTDAALAAEEPLPVPGSDAAYSLNYAVATDWEFHDDADPAPRMVYIGDEPRVYQVTVNGHWESLAADGAAHLPFVNLFRNATNVHHTHAGVIIDVEPILEGSASITTFVTMSKGDYLTLTYGSDNTAAAHAVQTEFWLSAIALTSGE